MTTQNIMANEKTVTVRGVNVNSATIGAYSKASGNKDARLSTWANAAAFQVVEFGNKNWMLSLFSDDNQDTRTPTGKLSAYGREVAQYVKAYANISVSISDGGGVKVVFNKKNAGLFNSEEKDDNGAPVKIQATESLTFPKTIAEYQAAKAADNGEPAKVKEKKASTFTKSLEKMLATTNGSDSDTVLSGTHEDMAALATAAKDLYMAAAKASADAESSVEGLNLGAVEQLESVVSSDEKRAY